MPSASTPATDRLTFAIGCGIAGIAGAAFTTIGSTGPTTGSLYIVDTFLVVIFGGAASLLGTVASAFGIAQTQSITEFFLTGSMAKVLTLSPDRADPDDPSARPVRLQGAPLSRPNPYRSNPE